MDNTANGQRKRRDARHGHGGEIELGGGEISNKDNLKVW